MDSAGTNADKSVTDSNLRAVQKVVIIGKSNDKTGKVIFAFVIKTGHFSGFSSDKRAIGFLTTCGNAFDNIPGSFHIQLSH